MNEEYLKLKNRMEAELSNEIRMRQIVSVVLDYYQMGKSIVIGNSQIQPVVNVRQMIAYVAYFIYGVPALLVTKHLKYSSPYSIYQAADSMKLKLSENKRIHRDLENIRADLAKVVNANHA